MRPRLIDLNHDLPRQSCLGPDVSEPSSLAGSGEHERYMAFSGLPLRNIVRRVNPPRWEIQRRTEAGYIKYIMRVAPAFVSGRPRGPMSQAA